MGKFKVGDRVRWARNDRLYQNATVTENDTSMFDYRIEQDGDYTYAYEDELVPVAKATGTFKVGDRVRSASNDCSHGQVGTIVKDDKSEVPFLVRFDDWRNGHGDDDNEWWLLARVLEPATLTIEAGRFYKTRDGRKVGPIKVSGGLYGAPGFTDYEWYETGFVYSDNREDPNDLIAEWQSDNEPAAPAATTNPAIVCRLDNGQPLPSTKPFVHANVDAASAEAARLAKKHPGKAFAVYEYKRTAKVEPVYDHEWQRLAAQGNAVDAERELIRRTGISATAAHIAVQMAAA